MNTIYTGAYTTPATSTYYGSEGPGGGDLRGGEGEGVSVGGEDHSLRGRSFLETVSTKDPYPVADVVTAAINSCWVPFNMTTSDFDNVHNVVCGTVRIVTCVAPDTYIQEQECYHNPWYTCALLVNNKTTLTWFSPV